MYWKITICFYSVYIVKSQKLLQSSYGLLCQLNSLFIYNNKVTTLNSLYSINLMILLIMYNSILL